MKALLFALLLLAGLSSFAPEAGAVVCARGVYRAGCAGPAGAVVARRPVYAPRPYGVRVYRRW
jgi:hypothetical protein